MKPNELKKHPLLLLLSWAGSDRKWLILSAVTAFLSGLTVIVPYIGIYRVLDAVFTRTVTRDVIVDTAFLMAVFVVIRFAAFCAAGVFSHKGAYGALYRVRSRITEHLAKIPMGELDERNTGSMKTVLNDEIEKLELFLAHNLPELLIYCAGPVAIFLYLLSVNVPLALLSLLPILPAVGVMGVSFAGMNETMEDATRSIKNLNQVILEYLNGMKLIKALGLKSRSFRKFSDAVAEEHRMWVSISKKMGPPYAAFVVLIECGMLFLIPAGGYLFLKGSITESIFLLFAFVGSLYLTEIRPLQELGSNFANVLNAVKEADAILEIPTLSGTEPVPDRTDIAFQDVTFSYDGGAPALKQVNLTVKEGEHLALVGPSGSGKSTLLSLVARFYDVTEGTLSIGGKDVRTMDPEKLLEQISIVFQKTFLSQESVLENIRMGSDHTLEEVRAAAREARIDSLIESLPDGYDTRVGSFGSRFSGGETQRIAIARAILKNAPILILDEATSASDPENQAELDAAITSLCRGKTVITAAHRLSGIRNYDRIAVLENHRVTAVGTHEELLETSPYYRHAWDSYRKARSLPYQTEGGIPK